MSKDNTVSSPPKEAKILELDSCQARYECTAKSVNEKIQKDFEEALSRAPKKLRIQILMLELAPYLLMLGSFVCLALIYFFGKHNW